MVAKHQKITALTKMSLHGREHKKGVKCSQREREKQVSCINTHIYIERERESRKMVLMNLFAGQQRRHRHREQICGWRVGRRVGDEWRG